jgi:prepilin-type N-terminal cleavage/methylation domain-containing protein
MTKKGFTLIELLIVIAILGFLSTVGLASFRSSQIKGRDAQRKSDLGQIQRALEAYFNDKGEYIDALPSGGSTWIDPDESETIYMKELPEDPKFGDYYYTSDGLSYKIYARLENTKDAAIPDSGSYEGTDCDPVGDIECNYGVSSANVVP